MLKIGADSEIHDKKGDSRLVEILLKCLEDRYMDSSLTLDDLVSQSSLGRAAYVNRIESLTQMPLKAQVHDNVAEIHGVCIKSDPDTGKAISIERIDG